MIIESKDWEELSEYRDFLEHHGVKGMKWYQHLFGKEQSHAKYNKSSSGSDSKSKKKEQSAKARAEKKEERAKAKETKKAEKAEAERQKILKDPKKLFKNRDKFTYDEINEAMKRFEWEKKLDGYSKDQMERGEKYLKHINTQATNLINIWNTAARVANSFGDDDNKLPFIIGIPKEKKKSGDQSNN